MPNWVIETLSGHSYLDYLHITPISVRGYEGMTTNEETG